MKSVRLTVAALILALSSIASPASATTYSTDQSDLWWNADESGWGFQIVQRGSLIFLTMYVYGPGGAPTWYTALLTPASPGSLVWAGDLYATNGPWFGAVPYDPNLVGKRKVGTMTWSPRTDTSGTLNYVIDGAAVTKSVVRTTLVVDDYGGTYLGAFHDATTGCVNPANNVAPSNDPAVTIAVTQNGQGVVISLSHVGWSITISGTLAQDGQFGTVNGTYSSSAGEVGNANVFAINVQTNSLTASYSLVSTNNGCENVGYFSGMRAR